MIFKIQPASIPDHLTEDGQLLSKRPYPLTVDESGEILNDSIQFVKVIGFVADLAKQQVDLWFADLTEADWPRIPGMYVIAVDPAGRWATLATAV